MQIVITPQPLLALIAGILIFIFPKLLNYIVAIYLIVIGILGLVRWLACESSIAGKLSDNPKLEAEGTGEKIAGKIQEKIGQVKKVLGDWTVGRRRPE